jgi:RHS repeat-associated protein
VLAGSEIARDTARREEVSKDLGLSTRQTGFGYDNRGRLTSNTLLGEGSGSVTDTLFHADFRHDRTVKTDSRDLAELGAMAAQVVAPSWTATQTDLHQYDQRTIANEAAARTYTFEAGRRTSDGSWTSEYDAEGRLFAIQKDTERIEFTYGPSGRLVGRQALKKNGTSWENEDRQSILDNDGLPAGTTFVWDPVVDRLVAVFEAEKSVSGAPADAGLIRQYVHGDQGYDDPVEVSTKRGDGTVVRYLPLVDEAGSGSVQAVVAPSGLLAERALYADPYGDAPRYLQGPVVDKIEVEPTKAADGTISKVIVRVRLSETVDTTTIFSGLRVSAVNSIGAVIATASGQITASAATVSMAIAGSDWNALASTPGATQIEIAVANTLRAAVWDGPVMPMPAWLLQNPSRGSTTQFPVIQRESLASLASFVGSLQTGESRAETLLQIHDLYLAGSSTSVTKLLTGYKAAPFVEPRSGFAYFRSRWYDPATGTFLTTDPLGMGDSSNTYAGMALDPVNRVDPTGELSGPEILYLARLAALSAGGGSSASVGTGAAGGAGASLVAPIAIGTALVVGPFAVKTMYEEHLAQKAEECLQETRALIAAREQAVQVPMLPGVTPYSQQAQAMPAAAQQLAQYHNQAVGGTGGATPLIGHDRGVYFFDEVILPYIDKGSTILGRTGDPHFFMSIADAEKIHTHGDAARQSGMAPSVVRAYINRRPIYGVSFPVAGLSPRVPMPADARGWPHYLEGGRTAVALPGSAPNTVGGYLRNSTQEYVVSGGAAMPKGSVLFELMPDGSWRVIRRF